jgi:serine protease AprX
MSAVRSWRNSARLLSAAVATALVPLVAIGPAGFHPDATARPGGGWSGLWLSAESSTSGGTSLRDVRTIIGADIGAAANLTGAGVGVALIDTGVAAVPGCPRRRS